MRQARDVVVARYAPRPLQLPEAREVLRVGIIEQQCAVVARPARIAHLGDPVATFRRRVVPGPDLAVHSADSKIDRVGRQLVLAAVDQELAAQLVHQDCGFARARALPDRVGHPALPLRPARTRVIGAEQAIDSGHRPGQAGLAAFRRLLGPLELRSFEGGLRLTESDLGLQEILPDVFVAEVAGQRSDTRQHSREVLERPGRARARARPRRLRLEGAGFRGHPGLRGETRRLTVVTPQPETPRLHPQLRLGPQEPRPRRRARVRGARDRIRLRRPRHRGARHLDVLLGRPPAPDDLGLGEQQDEPQPGSRQAAGGRDDSRVGRTGRQDPGPRHAGRGTAGDILTPSWRGRRHFSSSWPPRAGPRSSPTSPSRSWRSRGPSCNPRTRRPGGPAQAFP